MMMYLLIMLPFLAYIAYYDWKDRNIPQWGIAFSWLFYAVSFAYFPLPSIESYTLSLFLPIMGLGFLWCWHLLVEMAHKRELLARKYLKPLRFGLGEVFILPLMIPIIAQLGVIPLLEWCIGSAFFGSFWFSTLKKDSYHYRKGIPFLTFAFVTLVLFLLYMSGK